MPKEDKTPDSPGEKQTFYVCPYCEKAFKSKNALNGHLGVCKARPDPDIEDNEEDDEDEGIEIFPKRKDSRENYSRREEPVDYDEDGYQCGACGHVSSRRFRFCPECGEENDFE